MKRSRLHMALSGAILLLSLNAWAADVVVIVNTNMDMDQISSRELKSVFLQETNVLGNGGHVEPVLEKGGPAHEAFLKQYLGQSDDRLQKYYRGLVFTGRSSMPKVFSSDAAIVAYVSKTRGVIGYVSGETNTEGAKILDVVDAADGRERRLTTRVEPAYPQELQSRAIGGTVRLKITIMPKGNVTNVRLLGGNPILGESAIVAVQAWRYAPASFRTTMEVQIPFDPR